MARVIFLTDFSEEYARGILRGMARYSQETGQAWNLIRLPLSIRDKFGIEAVVKWARKMKADAVIGQFYNTDNVDLFRQNGIIAVAQDFKKRFATIPNITGPHRLAGRMCAEYYLQRGFRNFAFYGTRNIVWSDERCLGYHETIKQANPEYTFSTLHNHTLNDLWYYDSMRVVTWLQGLPKPVAIMACDDNQAYQLTEACRQIEGGGNRIPEDIAILGVDNDESMCKLSSPNLSSLQQSVEQGGYDVARLIDRLIKNPDAEWEDVMVIPTHIVTRQSTDVYAHSDSHIARVLQFIHENINQKLSVEQLVEQVPMSRRLLETRFKKEMGYSLYDYIIQARIERMTQLLCDGLSISEAAADLGFADIKNVSRTFKQLKGMTPSEYREKVARPKK